MKRDEAIEKWIIPAIKNTWNEKKCKEILEALEPKTGRWVDMGYTIPSVQSNKEWRCDNCQHQYRWFEPTPEYCPNCGADMRGGKE